MRRAFSPRRFPDRKPGPSGPGWYGTGLPPSPRLRRTGWPYPGRTTRAEAARGFASEAIPAGPAVPPYLDPRTSRWRSGTGGSGALPSGRRRQGVARLRPYNRCCGGGQSNRRGQATPACIDLGGRDDQRDSARSAGRRGGGPSGPALPRSGVGGGAGARQSSRRKRKSTRKRKISLFGWVRRRPRRARG